MFANKKENKGTYLCKIQGISYCNLEILKLKYLLEVRKQFYPWKKSLSVLLQSRERFTVNWFGRQNMLVVRRKICGWPALWKKIPKLWSFRLTLFFAKVGLYQTRDVTTGATGATMVAAKFSDSLTLSQTRGSDSAHHRRGRS